MGGAHEREGILEIFLNQRWGVVCGDNWRQQESGFNHRTVCAQLGFDGGDVRYLNSTRYCFVIHSTGYSTCLIHFLSAPMSGKQQATPPRPPYTGLHADINPPLQNIPRVNTLPVIDLSKTLQKAYQANALSERSRMTLVSAS